MIQAVQRLGQEIYGTLQSYHRRQLIVVALTCMNEGVLEPIAASRMCIRIFLQEHPNDPCPGLDWTGE